MLLYVERSLESRRCKPSLLEPDDLVTLLKLRFECEGVIGETGATVQEQ